MSYNKELNAASWMLKLEKVNPEYTSWDVGDDYMKGVPKDGKHGGWDAGVRNATWSEFGPWGLDELNELVNFKFVVTRASKPCVCESGYNPGTHQISEDFYDFEEKGTRWCDNITEDEVDALIREGRIRIDAARPRPTVAEVNKTNRLPGMGGLNHDSINKWILIETRARRLGVWGKCEICNGEASIYTEPQAHVRLSLWFIHPRKGCSRGVAIDRIEKHEVPAVLAYLQEGRARNNQRFEKAFEALKRVTKKS